MRNGFLLSLLIFCGFVVHAMDMEYVSPEKKTELEREFTAADFSSKSASLIKQKIWICDMYGVRTRLQVKRGVKLYTWKQDNWHNDGAQIVRDYAVDGGRLNGTQGPLEDEVKLNAKGQLVSRLSLTRPERQVVAYAVCDTP